MESLNVFFEQTLVGIIFLPICYRNRSSDNSLPGAWGFLKKMISCFLSGSAVNVPVLFQSCPTLSCRNHMNNIHTDRYQMNRAPGNCILKPGMAHFLSSTENECFCMMLAHDLNLSVPPVEILALKDQKALLVKRYDRIDDKGEVTRMDKGKTLGRPGSRCENWPRCSEETIVRLLPSMCSDG